MKRLIVFYFFILFASACFAQRGLNIFGDAEDDFMNVPKIMIQTGHSGRVQSIAYNADTTVLVSGSEDKTIKLWDVASGKILRTLMGHRAAITSVACDSEKKIVASASKDRTVKLWSMLTGENLYTFDGHKDEVTTVTYNADYTVLASGSLDGTVKIWDTTNKTEIGSLVHTSGICSAVWNSDTTLFAAGTFDGTVKIWDMQNQKELHTFTGHTSEVVAVAWSSDAEQIISASKDGTIIVWDVKNRNMLYSIPADTAAGSVTALAYSPDANLFAASSNSAVKQFESTTGSETQLFEGLGELVYSIAYGTDKKTLAAGLGDGKILIWHRASGKVARIFSGASNGMTAVAYSADGSKFATVLWNNKIHTSEMANSKISSTLTGHRNFISTLAYSPDGKLLASGSWDSTVKIWNMVSGSEIRQLSSHTNWISAVTFDFKGAVLASGDYDGTILLQDVTNGNTIRTFKTSDGVITALAFHPDGNALLFGTQKGVVKQLDITSGTEEILLENAYSIRLVKYSNDGTLLSCAMENGLIKILDAATGNELHSFSDVDRPVLDIVYGTDNKTLTATHSDGITNLWGISEGNLRTTTVSNNTGEQITWTPEGYFDGSQWAAKNLVHIVDGMDVYYFSQLDEALYRPDLVEAKKNRKITDIPAAINTLLSVLQSGKAPLIEVVAVPQDTGSRDIVIELKVQDTGGGIGKIYLQHNNRNILLSDGVVSENDDTVSFSSIISLSVGKNLITAYAYNKTGLIESDRNTQTLVWNGVQKEPRLIVFALAVNEYSDSNFPKLQYAVADAEGITAALKEAGSSLYTDIIIKKLYDKQVTTKNFTDAFDSLKKTVQPDDVFVLYLAGHGISFDGDYFFIPADFQTVEDALDESVQEQGLSKEILSENLSKIVAQKSVIIIDSCQSGSFASEIASREAISKTLAERLYKTMGHAVITASSEIQSAYEDSGNGIFTAVLMQGIRGKADENKDGKIILSELSAYAAKEVPPLVPKLGAYQIPQYQKIGNDFPFVSAKPVQSLVSIKTPQLQLQQPESVAAKKGSSTFFSFATELFGSYTPYVNSPEGSYQGGGFSVRISPMKLLIGTDNIFFSMNLWFAYSFSGLKNKDKSLIFHEVDIAMLKIGYQISRFALHVGGASTMYGQIPLHKTTQFYSSYTHGGSLLIDFTFRVNKVVSLIAESRLLFSDRELIKAAVNIGVSFEKML